jgi:hypothetical protein
MYKIMKDWKPAPKEIIDQLYTVFDGKRGVTLSKAGNSVQHTTP